MKVLIAPNSFKECADSETIASLFRKYLDYYFNAEQKINAAIFIEKPISDGGDGFLSVCKNNFDLEIKSYPITYPYNENVFECEYGVTGNTAYIESAKVLGLNFIPMEKRHPLLLSSKGLGEILIGISNENKISQNKITKVIIGVGGTGTCDFGIGMCSRFGLKLLDKNNNELEPLPINFYEVEKIIWNKPDLDFAIDLVLDVTNPLLGDEGAARIFAPQKGAAPDEVEILENGLKNICELLNRQYPNFKLDEMYGAVGGLAGGLHYFFNANYVFSKDFISDGLGINERSTDADIIITGEGCFDIQSSYNKGVLSVVNNFKHTGKPVFICAGIVENSHIFKNDPNLFFIELSGYFNSKEESIQNIGKGIQLACKEIFEICKSHHYIS